MSEVKYLDIKEFREKGYLFELNRQFLHPLGLALEIHIDEEGNEVLGGIWDYRNDPEGMLYDDKMVKSEVAINKRDYVQREYDQKAQYRVQEYGFVIQPVG